MEKEPPKDIDASIRAKLQSQAVQLLDGEKPAYEFWLCSEIPLQSKPASTAKALDAVKETTLLGAVSVATAKRDYRDDELPAGVYTMRFVLQPQDGDHLGPQNTFTSQPWSRPSWTPNPMASPITKSLVKASAKAFRPTIPRF